MGATFELDPGGLLAVLNDGPAIAHVTDVAKQGQREAERIAPEHTGHYKDRLGYTPGEPTSEGAKASFGSLDSAWHLVEFGSANNAPYRVLTRAALALGLDFRAQ